MPIISVIIPCFNDGQYIQESIESVNNQTFKNFEIIIVDDGSTDKKTIDVLSDIEQKNLQVLFLDKNVGLPTARNKGIETARGKYILPLDADDKIAPSYLEKSKEVLDKNNNIGIVYCEAEFFGTIQQKWELSEFNFQQMIIGNMIFASAMFRKSDWEKVGGYNKNMIYGYEDYDFWLSLLELKRKVYRIPEVLFYYRQKEISMVNKLDNDVNKQIKTFTQIFNNHKKLYENNIEIIFTELIYRLYLIQEKEQQLQEKEQQLQEKDQQIQEKETHIQNQDLQIQHWHNVAQSMRIKNRIKRLAKKVTPQKLWKTLRYYATN